MEIVDQLRARVSELEAKLDDARSCEAREACRALQFRDQRDAHKNEIDFLNGEVGRVQHSANQAVELIERAETALAKVKTLLIAIKATADEAEGVGGFATGLESGSTKLIVLRRRIDEALDEISIL